MDEGRWQHPHAFPEARSTSDLRRIESAPRSSKAGKPKALKPEIPKTPERETLKLVLKPDETRN